MMDTRGFLYAFCLCAAVSAAPALADVKAGVDAWTAGDYAAAVREWREPAAKGDPDAQFNLAQAYRLGRGVEADPAQAEVLYAKAAAQGHLKAADNYGLLLFQDGRREAAMPYLTAASERGDPRAQYLIGLAHFNGDLLPKDWVRAYALLTLSNSAGLPQAAPAIKQMDSFIPREQREQAQTLAQALNRDADAARSAQLAAADLGADMPSQSVAPAAVAAVPSPPAKTPIRSASAQPTVDAARDAISAASQATGTENPANAGADYARPARQAAASTPEPDPQRAPVRTAQASKPPAAPNGVWKVQLGAFSVGGNAEKLWRQLSSRSELAGRTRLLVPAGNLTRLLAGGYPSQAAANQACASLKRAGHSCLVTR
ncbi:MAG: SPOR domain-containing protein [Allopontixanthobacter sediminis]